MEPSATRITGLAAVFFACFSLAGCGPEEAETDQAAVPEGQTATGIGSVAPDPHDPEALSPPQLSRTADDSINNASGSEDAISGVGQIASPEAANQVMVERIREELANVEELELSDEQLDEIEIRIRQGAIELSGTVPSAEAGQNVEQRVREITGIDNIDNNLVANR